MNTIIAITVLAVLLVGGTTLWLYARRLEEARLLRRKPHQLAESLEAEPETGVPRGGLSNVNVTNIDFGQIGGDCGDGGS